MSVRRIFMLAALLVLLSGSALADHLEWVGPDNGAYWGASGVNYYVSPYKAHDTSQPPAPNGVLLTIYCVDFNHEIAPPFEWDANIYALTQDNVTNHSQYGDFAKYQEAAWLFEHANTLSVQSGQTGQKVAQVAVWTLFARNDASGNHLTQLNNLIAGSGYTASVQSALTSASNATPTGTWSLVTGGQGADFQEFITNRGPFDLGSVPEPGALVLFGTVIGILAPVCYRRRRA
jgi:hypothetical protein